MRPIASRDSPFASAQCLLKGLIVSRRRCSRASRFVDDSVLVSTDPA
jgi:hypothetical protein